MGIMIVTGNGEYRFASGDTLEVKLLDLSEKLSVLGRVWLHEKIDSAICLQSVRHFPGFLF